MLREVELGLTVTARRPEHIEFLGCPLVHVRGLDLGDVHAQGTMDAGAVEADEDAKVLARPPRVQRLAVEAVPVFFSRHELVEELIAISLVRHGGAISKTRALGTLPSTPVSSDRDRSRGFPWSRQECLFRPRAVDRNLLIGPLDWLVDDTPPPGRISANWISGIVPSFGVSFHIRREFASQQPVSRSRATKFKQQKHRQIASARSRATGAHPPAPSRSDSRAP